MKYLLDTNILPRLVEPNHARRNEVAQTLKNLKIQNAEFYIVPQNASEFWNVCTHPKDKKRFGLFSR